MRPLLLGVALALGCATGAAGKDPSGKASPNAANVGAAGERGAIHVSAELVPLAQASLSRPLPTRLVLKSDGRLPVVLLFALPGTQWLRRLGEGATVTQRVEPGETVCVDQSAERVRLEPGQVWTRELLLKPFELWSENFVGVNLRIPVVLADRPCARVQFVEERLTLHWVAGGTVAAPPAAAAPRPIGETRIPNLIAMLSSDHQTMLVLDALFSMRDVDHYDVAANRELMALLDTAVAGIQESSLRERAAKYLDALRTGAPRPEAPPAAAGTGSPVRVP